MQPVIPRRTEYQYFSFPSMVLRELISVSVCDGTADGELKVTQLVISVSSSEE